MTTYKEDKLVIGVVGNPNCGKTTLFNALTGARQQVGNWPGVTVERKVGMYRHAEKIIELVDLPGTYSLDSAGEATSVDETIARDYILAQEADAILNIVDASNLERNLYLTVQLLEMRVPMLVALNMSDLAREQGQRIDAEALSRQLGCPVIPISAASGEGLEILREALEEAARRQFIPSAEITYHPFIEKALEVLNPHVEAAVGDKRVDLNCLSRIEQADGPATHHLPPAHHRRDNKICCRWLALRLLEEDPLAFKLLQHDREALRRVSEQRQFIEEQAEEEADILIADSRYNFINQLTTGVLRRSRQAREAISERLDRVFLNRWLGIPLFLLVMYLVFWFTINLGGAFVDLFDGLAGAFLVDGLREALLAAHFPAFLAGLLADGLGGGVQVVATFIPILGFMYLFLSLLEYSGYMARAAFVMDRFMQMVGLPGKSFVPLIVGFGCNVPAIMAARTLESRRDRLLTMMMAPFMSCGARLPVYVLFIAAFFPSGGGQNLVFLLYLIGIGVALLTGWILKQTLLKGEGTPFIMELPPYHVPRLKNVFWHTWERLRGFVFGAGKIIVPMVMLIHLLSAWQIGPAEEPGPHPEQSALSEVGRILTPAFAPMGITPDNWPATVGLFTGVLAKETVVGSLDAIYGRLARAEAEIAEEDAFNLAGAVAAALSTVPANLSEVLNQLLDPLGLSLAGADRQTVALEMGVEQQVFGAMAQRFDGQAGAFAYLLFILLYFPCVATVAAIYREAGPGWAVFISFWSTFLAYAMATLFYQVATFERHPTSSVSWIIGLLLALGLLIWGLRQVGLRHLRNPPPGRLSKLENPSY